MARCAEANLENLKRMLPTAFTQNPMLRIVDAQLRSVIDILEGGDGTVVFCVPNSEPDCDG